MKSGVIAKINEEQQYKIMKLIVAVIFTLMLCAMFFIMIPLNKDMGTIERIWTYASTLLGVFVFMIIQVNIVSFVYNRFIASDIEQGGNE